MINNNRKMSLMEELEKKALYGEELEKEIISDLNILRERPSGDSKNLLFNDLETKLEYAESKGLNINKLKNQFNDFRITSFSRDIEKKIENIKEKGDFFNTDLSKIEEEYDILKNIEGINIEELDSKMEKLNEEVMKGRLLFKVKDMHNSGGTSIYNIDIIQEEYLALKDKGIDMSEIEEILFDI